MNSNKMETKKVLPLLMEFSIPAIIGMLVNAIYNIVDRIFIGNVPELGSRGLAGITVSYPVTLIVMAISLMIGVGGATRFSISLGEKRSDKAGQYMGNALTLTIILGLIVTVAGNLFMEPLLKFLGASDAVYPYAASYLSIILYGCVFQCIAMSGNNFSRAQGNPKNAMVSQLIGAGFNIVFDYILIIKMGMGMQGAALATVGGQFLSAVWQLAFLFGKRSMIKLNLELMKLKISYAIDIIRTGIPVFFMQISNSLLNIILNMMLSTVGGDVALSTIGIVTSVQALILMPIVGIMQGQQPLISYNYGAGNLSRVKETLKYAALGASAIAIIGFISVQLFTRNIILLFNQESAVIEMGYDALRIWFICLPVIGIQIMCANFFQCIGMIKTASFLTLLRQVILLIPLILILGNLFGLYGLFFAGPIADFFSFTITGIFIIRQLKKM